MAIDIDQLTSSLSEGLRKQRAEIAKPQRYYDGKTSLSFATKDYADQFVAMLQTLQDNWMPIIVDAVAERMRVEGFRFGDGKGDVDAWDIWQRNGMDADSDLLFSEVRISGVGYVLVWGEEGTAEPGALLSVEDPEQVYVSLDPANRRHRLAAIKEWADEWGDVFRNVYLPNEILKWRQRKGKWEELGSVRNPIGVVPVVPFLNRPRIKPGTYRSELLEAMSTQDQINKILADAIVASEFSAYRQRYAIGVEVEKDEDGNPINPFKSGQNRVWIAPDPEARFGSFEAADLSSYTRMLENRIQSIASRTRTPPHYLLGGAGTFPSGESLKATETGLIAKTRNRMRRDGESLEEVMRLAFLAEGDAAKGAFYRAETIWADPESRTEVEHVDALSKLRALKVPYRKLWEDAGYSQEDISRFLDWLREESLNQYLANGAPPAPIDSVPTTTAP